MLLTGEGPEHCAAPDFMHNAINQIGGAPLNSGQDDKLLMGFGFGGMPSPPCASPHQAAGRRDNFGMGSGFDHFCNIVVVF